MQDLWLEFARYAQVILGISLVIFVHEAGHFVCARLCGVRVEVFSLGMGPRIFGWRRGPTLYQVAAIPIGGYVRMAGEESAESRAAPAPDELHGKSVGQRFLIYSGGVLANVAFGLVVFPIIFAVGVPCAEPVLGPSSPGSPAWHASLPVGTRVLAVNDHKIFEFSHIITEVALGSPQETVLEVLEPGATSPRTVHLVPVWSEAIGAHHIGVNPAVDSKQAIRVEKGSAAARAGLRNGDQLRAVECELPALPIEDQVSLATRDGAPLKATIERDGQEIRTVVEPSLPEEAKAAILGITPLANFVIDHKDTELVTRAGLRKNDRILSIGGFPLRREYDFALALDATRASARARVERDGQILDFDLGAWTAAEVLELNDTLAVAHDKSATRVIVEPGTNADRAGLRDGDRILSIDGRAMESYQQVLEAARGARKGHDLTLVIERTPLWRAAEAARDLYPRFGIASLPLRVATLVAFRAAALDAPPAKGHGTRLTLKAAVSDFRMPEYGLAFQAALYTYRTNGPVESISAGIRASWKFLEESFLTLKRILLGHVSGSNIGGIITIGVVSHSWASLGMAKLFFFLCMLSMNLAFLNVLPIPVFDGGHLLFLLIEKVKGSPVSERVLSYSQMVGIVLIVSLMIWVTYSDVMKWFVHR